MKITTYLHINDLMQSVDSLNVKNEGLFINLGWFQNYENNINTDGEFKIFCLTDESSNSLVVYPMEEVRDVYRKLPIHKLTAMSNYYSSLYGPIKIAGEDSNDIYQSESFVSHVRTSDRPYDVINFQPLSQESTFYKEIEHALTSNGFFCKKYFCFGNWYLNLEGRSYEEYYKSLPSKLRNTIKRKGSKLSKEHIVDFVLVTDKKELLDAMVVFDDIYKKSWKQDEPYPNFIKGLAELGADCGGLRLGVLYVNDVPVAAQLWIVFDGVANIFKLAYDPEWKSYSVGSILTAKLMQEVIDKDKVHTVDYLTGDDSYKQDWMSNRRERWGIIAFNKRTLKGFLLGLVEKISDKLKKLLRK